MHDRSTPIVVTPRACPFVALDGDRDRRLDAPDPLHRCFAEQIPRARSISHQAEFCLSPAFTGCPIFQDWATRAAAQPVTPRVALPQVSATPVEKRGDGVTATGSIPADRFGSPDRPQAGPPSTGDTSVLTPPRPTRALEAQAADEELLATRSVPSYRAVPATSPTAAVPTTRPDRVEEDGAPGGFGGTDQEDDIPVIRSIPTPRPAAAAPLVEEDWTAPPPWLRPPTGPVWIAEAVPPPDALADIGTQPARRPRPSDPFPAALDEAMVPGGDPAVGAPAMFGEDTTGMPFEIPTGRPQPARAGTQVPPDPRITEAVATGTGPDTGTQPLDPGVSAELAASRYRADVAAGLVPDEELDAGADPRPAGRGRRVPIDIQAAASLGSQSQARPTVRSTGSREWEGPRRFEAYAATQRRRPPTSLIVGGSAIALAVVLLGVFLLPGLLMGGAPAMTATPDPSTQVAAVVGTEAPSESTPRPARTADAERTPKPRTYTVKSGDTLIKIAKRFKVRVDRITCLNRIRNPNNVAVGRTLTIPPKGYRCPSD